MDQRSITISGAFKTCLNRLEVLVLKLKTNTNSSLQGLDPTSWEDELGRLKVWGGNLAAHQTGRASLEYRLRDASHIQQNIVELLTALHQVICDVEEVLADPPMREFAQPPEPSNPGSVVENEFQQLYRETVSIIKDLFQMALLIRKPAHHSRLTEDQPDVSFYKTHDFNHVRDKFPEAHRTLLERLSLALTRRRAQLRYWERHHAKLNKGLGLCARPEQLMNDNATELSNTVATSFMATSPVMSDDSSCSVTPEGSFASTFVQSETIHIPNPPKDSIDGAPFECPFCRHITVVQNRREWNKHLFLDLKPYSCTALDCNAPHRLYGTQHEWSSHLRSDHDQSWLDDSYNGQYSLAVCPLCKSKVTPGRDSESHVARHFQELALFVAPQVEYDDDEELSYEDYYAFNPAHGSDSPKSLHTPDIEHESEVEHFADIDDQIVQESKDQEAKGIDTSQELHPKQERKSKHGKKVSKPPTPIYWICRKCSGAEAQSIKLVPLCLTLGCSGKATDYNAVKLNRNRKII